MINARFDDKLYHQHYHRLIATWANDRIAIGSLPSGGVGKPSLLWQQFAHAAAITPALTIGQPIIADGKAYVGHHQTLDGTWYHKDVYQRVVFGLSVSWSSITAIFAVGIDGGGIGVPSLTQQQFIHPPSIYQSNFGHVYTLHSWQYALTWYHLNVSWLGKKPHKSINSTAFHVAWFLPDVSKQSIGVIGWQGGIVSTPSIANYHAYINTSGIYQTHLGTPSITNKARVLNVRGIYPSNFGTPHIINKTQIIKTGNLGSQLVFGKPTIALAEQFIQVKGFKSGLFGISWLSHYVRHITGQGRDFGAVGRHWLSHHTRFITPSSIYGDKGKDFASNHLVGGTQTIVPDGFIATLWLTRIIPENQTIGIEKGISGEFGIPAVDNHTQYICPAGFGFNDNALYGERFGKGQIYNLRQYITQYFIQNSGLTPQILDPDDPTSQSDFGRWTSISNKNRTIATFGSDTLKFGYHALENKARIIAPEAIASEMGEPLVAYRIRRLGLDGIEPPHFSYWHIIYNRARVLKPDTINEINFGTASIINTRRYFGFIGNIDSLNMGLPMIADRIRTIDIEWRYSIAPPTIALPTIENHTRYINPKGFDDTDGFKKKFGRAELMERFNIIRTHGRTGEIFGQEVIVRNVTPELKLFGHNSQAFGEPVIRTQWRNLYAKGDVMTKIGLHKIADSKQNIKVDGIGANKISTLHHIKKLNTPPYATQYIDLNKYIYDQQNLILIPQKDGYGIEPPKYPVQVPAPKLQSNNILPEGEVHTEFGQATVSTNVIEIPSGIAILGVGEPKIWIKTQFIHATGIDNHIDDKKMGKPRLSPHTIYAPSSDMATAQARHNHPPRSVHIINSMAVFGVADVANQHRSIYHYNGLNSHQGVMSVFGRASLEHKQRTIAPTGFRGGYFGWHSIPFVPQTIEHYDDNHHAIFGQTTVAIANYDAKQYIRPKGLVALSAGLATISHFHRHIYPQGKLMSRLGQSKSGDTPFMWQGLRVGERVLGSYGGFESNVFGQTWISNKIREISASGFDSFVSEPDTANFKGRLKVVRVIDGIPKQRKPAQVVGAVGIDPNTIHAPNIKNKAHYIRPDGNSEQYRKGAW